jgi:hypothetical protein
MHQTLRRLALGLMSVSLACCAAAPRPADPPRLDKERTSDVARFTSLLERSDVPGTQLDAIMRGDPVVAASLSRPGFVLGLLRRGHSKNGLYLAQHWTALGSKEVAAFISDHGTIDEATFLASLRPLVSDCGPGCPSDVDLRQLVADDWSHAVTWLLENQAAARAAVNLTDETTGKAPLNEVTSPKMRETLARFGAVENTPEQMAATRALYEAKKAKEEAERELAKEEARAERLEREEKEAIAQARRDADADAARAQREEDAHERRAAEERAWKAASDGIDAFRSAAQASQAARLQEIQAQRPVQARPEASRPRETYNAGDGARAQRAEDRKRAAEAAIKRAEAMRREADDAARRAAEEAARREDARRRAADAAAAAAIAAAATPPTPPTPQGPEVFTTVEFTTSWPFGGYEQERSLAEQRANDSREAMAGEHCRAAKGYWSPREFAMTGDLNCEEKYDRFYKKSVYRCRWVLVMPRCRRSR